MGFGTAIVTCFRKYVDFEGRARRSEYWYFQLFILLSFFGANLFNYVAVVANSRVIAGLIGILFLLLLAGTFLPNLAVLVRRLHDTDHSGWWYFIVFLPLIGAILLLVWCCSKGTSGPNRYGQDPLGGGVEAVFS